MLSASLRQYSADQVPRRVGICSELSPVQSECVRGHGHRVWSPADICLELVSQYAGKQTHHQMSQSDVHGPLLGAPRAPCADHIDNAPQPFFEPSVSMVKEEL